MGRKLGTTETRSPRSAAVHILADRPTVMPLFVGSIIAVMLLALPAFAQTAALTMPENASCTRWSPANLDLSRRMGCLRIGANVTNVVFLTPRHYMKNTKIAVLCGLGASACESGPQNSIMKFQLSRPVARV